MAVVIWRSGERSSRIQNERPCVATIRSSSWIQRSRIERARQIQLKRLPVIAVVERDPDARLGAGEEEPASDRVLPHGVDRAVLREAGGDQLPRAPRRRGCDRCRG